MEVPLEGEVEVLHDADQMPRLMQRIIERVMMGACALLQPVASLRFFQTGAFAWGPAIGLAIGGSAGVLVAAYIVKSLPLEALRWLVIVVIAYAAIAMLRSAARREPLPERAAA